MSMTNSVNTNKMYKIKDEYDIGYVNINKMYKRKHEYDIG